ncbi:hypothetical protein NDU88_007795 [Pleurodeles waltl]|uniref:Uncharacterized protein n=1 Tax=Pleurodeles waltl TaxID=8319 RepID=A0AAV7U1L6_PLEWA|nr:hypothetical protein NDU88_007795 [Pleurodeles waltl]
MGRGPRHGTVEDRTFWELLLNYTERLRAEERPGCWGVRLGCRAREEVRGPITIQQRMRKGGDAGQTTIGLFWELLLDYTESLRAVERPGRWGVRLGCPA